MTRTWLGVIAVGALVAACAPPDPAAPGPASVETGSPSQRDAPGVLPIPITDKVMPSPLDAEPRYVIAPDPEGRRNTQSPNPVAGRRSSQP